MKNTSFFRSLLCALKGAGYAFLHERNLRFHFAVGNLICLFAYFYGLDRNGWAILLLTIAVVFAAELFNTSVEHAADAASKEWSEDAMHSKDTAAAAVLVCAAGSVAVGIALFGDIRRISETVLYIFKTPPALTVSLIICAADILLLVFGGKKE